MSMLAGPRRKQKVINLRAKNNAWSNDPNKFGQRMLEKMGWSSGKGLGAHENGMVEHVVARYKNDEKGLGFEDKNDQWTKHEDDFNALLANLSNGVGNEEKLHSGVSLEVKSKKSKARVHYHKFTRGKDLTRYSEKDLANIFGKKSLKNQSKEEVVEELQDDIKKTEQVFTEKGSMEDYFKNKLASLKTKVSYNSIVRDDEADYSFRGFAGTGDSEQNEPDVPSQDFLFYNESTTQTDEVQTKKKKKKKRNLENTENHEIVIESNFIEEAEVEEPIKKKKSKKKKKEPEDEAQNQEIIADIVEEECHVPKKKKKRKNKDNE